jgi:integrase/recombinase XerD
MTAYRTVAHVATELLTDPSLNHRTKKLYEGTLLPFLERHGRSELPDVSRQTIETYLNSQTHLNFRTHNLHQAVIHRLFSFAVERGYIQANPLTGIRRRKPDPAKGEYGSDEAVRHLSRKQVEIFFRAVSPNPRLTALISLLYESGVRISEVLALKLKSFDFEAAQFQVIGKGNKKRWCFFGERSSQAMKRYLDGGRHHPHHALFTERGAYLNDIRPLSYQTAHRDLQEAIRPYASLKGVRFHDLRHTFATERAQIVPLEVLRALLGHEKIQTTLIYQKITSQVAREAAHAALQKLALPP